MATSLVMVACSNAAGPIDNPRIGSDPSALSVVVDSSLALHLDASVSASLAAPSDGALMADNSTWYDLSGRGNNGKIRTGTMRFRSQYGEGMHGEFLSEAHRHGV